MPRHLLPTTRAKILALRSQKLSIYKIAKLMGVHPCTVSRTCKRHASAGDNLYSWHAGGRTRTLSSSDARFMALQLSRSRVCTAANIQRKFFPKISVATIRRRLREIGLSSYTRQKVPLLCYRHRLTRKAWAKQHETWRLAEWLCALFSDELKFNVFRSDGRHYCWRRPGEGLDPRYTEKMVKHGGGNVMVWGCITPKGVGRLIRIDGRLTAAKYIEILKEGLLGTLKDYKIPIRHFLFQQDNDPKHTAKITKAWFKEKSISVLPWPAQSPDMNIIENVWSYLDRKVHSRNPPPCNTTELWEALHEEWECIDQGFITKLYESMPNRIDALLSAKGGNTPY
ncbi:Transposable element Tcb2 transposase [Rhizoctonia solani]|uniref:Transposable element Tcb2 transposase n=1 Tax=Rhizoctonia solani TaxID=456999 RepID=A0A8H8NY34_9AGAM|nr:Transposable element Tcb2 transposase [Rhizoctonia solani]QRW20438.1 Transposable element Tcb2 transposase [Rhizoctonia solani]